MQKNIFRIVELLLDEFNIIHGVHAISLVDEPAIERDFMFFHKEYMTNFSTIDDEKRIVIGPALIPNKMILRKYKDEFFYVFFSKDTIRKTAHRFQIQGKQNNTTYQHSLELKGVSVVETWIKEDMVHDKSLKYGFEDLPIGTWFIMSKIEDDVMWDKIKSGEIKGYSIEGRFTDNILEAQKEKDTEPTLEELLAAGTEEERRQYQEIKRILEDWFPN